MKNLITGAAGFIGTNLSNFLLNNNEEVIGVDNFITGSKNNIDFLSKHPNFHFYNNSINDTNFINKLKSKKVDRIYHLACPTGVGNLKKIPMDMLLTSSEIFLVLLNKVLFCIHSSVFGTIGVLNISGYKSPMDLFNQT